MASTPVTAAPPEAKARSTTNRATAPVPIVSPPCWASSAGSTGGHLAEGDPTSPTITVTPRLTMNTYVGKAKILPDSRTPSRFA